MGALMVSTIASSLFGLTVKVAERRSCHLLAVGAVNYCTAALVYRIATWGEGPPSRATWVLGIMGGVAYVTAYLFLVRVVRFKGISISTAVVRLAVLFPVVFSVFLWGERPSWAQSAGVALAVVSLPLLGADGSAQGSKTDIRGMALTGALFLTNGGCLMAIRGFHQVGPRDEQALFFSVLFDTAAVVSVIAWWMDRAGSSKRDVVPGLFLGLWNTMGGFMLLVALRTLPGVVVFPFSSSLAVVLTTLVAMWAWGERFGKIGTVGMALATVAAVLINIG